MATIRNPILPGFNPDPNILRVGEDYYIATSTFQWFPGVQIHHSRDLVHWRLLTHPLTRTSQLDMTGDPCSGGIWAPQLSYADGMFWLIYTDVKSYLAAFKDTHNYLVTAPAITGPWSEPVYLNASGFDPSLFHDVDTGRKWLVNQLWDHRRGRNRFGGIVLQEYSHAERKLTGPVRNIFAGTDLKVTEGPHVYKFWGKYYLICAEGGTGTNHAVTVARADRIEGPYEVDPRNPMLTSRHNRQLALHKAGHASVVETTSGEWYIAHLCSRPLPGLEQMRCMLGRETALQKVEWTEDKWLRLAHGGNEPAAEVAGPRLAEHPWPREAAREDFDGERLSEHFATLRVPAEESWCSLRARRGYLRLVGRESMSSRHRQSLVARRVQAFVTETTTAMEFAPTSFKQMAGLALVYDVEGWYYLHITADDDGQRVLNLMTCNKNEMNEPLDKPVALPATGPVYLRVKVDHQRAQFAYSTDGQRFTDIGPMLDASLLSDEYVTAWGFTGAMVGLACQDLNGTGAWADFDWFEYREGQ